MFSILAASFGAILVKTTILGTNSTQKNDFDKVYRSKSTAIYTEHSYENCFGGDKMVNNGHTLVMRKRAMSIEEVKENVGNLLGQNLKISVNKGRKRIIKYDGSIENIYPSVFTLKILNNKNLDMLSCSYNDVICGDIKLVRWRTPHVE